MTNVRQIATLCTTSAMMIGLLAGCGSASTQSNAASGTQAASANKPQLILATSADYPPYEFHDMTGGNDQIKGFDMDVANQISKDLGFTFTVKDMSFDGLVGALQTGRADFVLAGMTPTPTREKNVDFSKLYYTAQNAIVEQKNGDLISMNQLVGKKVGVQTGSTQEQDAKQIKGATIVSLDTIPAIVQELKTGRIDAAIIESTVAKGYITNNPDLSLHMLPVSADNGSAVAFPKGSKWVAPFNKELGKMKADGELNQLIVKWFGGKQVK